MRLRYSAVAKDDLRIAFQWYEVQRRGLGMEFLDCVEVAIETVLEKPKLYAKHHAHFRRALVRRFPFSIFYTTEEKEIVLHAVFDNRRDPALLP